MIIPHAHGSGDHKAVPRLRPRVKANFLVMMRWIYKGIPLPPGSVDNLRSMVRIDNLRDLVSLCVEHPGARNRTSLASDDEHLSTTDLLRRLASALGKSARLFPMPPAILAFAATLIGKPSIAKCLCGTLQVDISETRSLLGWAPPSLRRHRPTKDSRRFPGTVRVRKTVVEQGLVAVGSGSSLPNTMMLLCFVLGNTGGDHGGARLCPG